MFDFIDRFKSWADALEFNFTRWRYLFGGVSAVLVTLSWVLFFTIGPNWGTDFTGGTEIHLKFDDPVAISELRDGLRRLGLSDDSVQAVNGEDSGEFVVRIADPTFGMEGLQDQMTSELAKLYGPDWVQSMSATAEVSARFVVDYKEPYKEYAQITKDLQADFPGARAAPGKDETEVVIDIPGLAQRIQERIAVELGDHSFKVLATDAVGPQVGADLRRQGFIAMAATWGLILVYVAFRFDLEYAPGAVVALFHDISMTIGVFVLFQLDFSLETVGALLTILGYSINDTIVIYDRIRENKERYRRGDIETLINKSVSETLARTIATNFTVFLAITTFLIWGGPVLRNFAIAMLCGQIFGTYSTVYIAAPLIIVFQDIKPYLARLMAVTDTVGGGNDDGGPNPGNDNGESGSGPVTESEKRRRARADADKKELLG